MDAIGSVPPVGGGSSFFGDEHAAEVQKNTNAIIGAMSDAMGLSGNNPDELLGQMADKLGMSKDTLNLMVSTAADPSDPNSKLASDVLGMLMKLKGFSNPFAQQ